MTPVPGLQSAVVRCFGTRVGAGGAPQTADDCFSNSLVSHPINERVAKTIEKSNHDEKLDYESRVGARESEKIDEQWQPAQVEHAENDRHSLDGPDGRVGHADGEPSRRDTRKTIHCNVLGHPMNCRGFSHSHGSSGDVI